MKYSYEYKLECIDLYKQGRWPATPDGTDAKYFHREVRKWVNIEKECGPEALMHKSQNKEWTAEEKYALVAAVLSGKSYRETAYGAGIETGLLYRWIRRYKIKGYEGLTAQRKGRPSKEPQMKKKELPAELTPSEREEMIRLRAENEVIKKRIALRRERWAEELKAKKQQSSKNSGKKDID